MTEQQKHNGQIQWLVKAVDMAFQKNQGLWADSLLDALEGLAAEQADWKPDEEGARSIWEIVDHVTFWKDAVIQRLERKPWPDASQDKDWLSVTEIGEAAWAKTVDQLKSVHEKLIQGVSQLQDEVLDQPFPDEERPIGEHLFGLVAHDSYHTGQILTLRQLQGIGL
ncbi:MAG: DinB family protein [Anaerolineae bacterium]